MTKLLITGGLGFIGTEVLRLLGKRKDIQATVYDNLMHFQDPQYTAKKYPHITLKMGDILDKDYIKYIARGFDVVLHMAAIVGTPACKMDPKFAFDVNVVGTHNIITSLDSTQRLILMSSTSAYGDKEGEIVTEETDLSPLTEYGVHKKANEVSNLLYGKSPFLVIRPATAFGPSEHMRLDILPNTLIFNALEKGYIDLFQANVTRTFIHVEDLARALIYGIDGNFGWNTYYNIGDPKYTMSKGDMAKAIAKLTKASITTLRGEDPDKRNYEIDFSKMTRAGFHPKKTLTSAVNAIRDMMPLLTINPNLYSTASRVEAYLRYRKQYDLYGTDNVPTLSWGT